MKVLVLGDGLLGSEIIMQTDWDYVSRKLCNFDIDRLDLLPNNYNVIVNCIANTDTYSNDMESHNKVNYEFVKDLVTYCNSRGIKLVHISTDYVYANNKSFAKETDTPSPSITHYAQSKLKADTYIQSIGSFGTSSFDYLICRCSHKPRPFPYNKAWVDAYTNADYVDVIADLIIKLIKKGASGLINVGTEPKTIYELAQQTNPNVQYINRPIYTPSDTTMDLTKLKEWI
jgi:dTDP-4-dehydrorhamnose reductase